MSDTAEILRNNNLKNTRQRVMVLDEVTSSNAAISQPDLEKKLGSEIDRVTLYRILSIYEDKGILHKIIDQNGTANYAVCSSNCNAHKHADEHMHFNCTACDRIFCLNVNVPSVKMPDGFEAATLNLIAYGTCDDCGKKAEA
ncbi:MAG: transcriptional repressor [Pedobacter sp.]|nr:MAG: transcriptional repressor [Pedobacter sp.]